jgi:hypothetical protein
VSACCFMGRIVRHDDGECLRKMHYERTGAMKV